MRSYKLKQLNMVSDKCNRAVTSLIQLRSIIWGFIKIETINGLCVMELDRDAVKKVLLYLADQITWRFVTIIINQLKHDIYRVSKGMIFAVIESFLRMFKIRVPKDYRNVMMVYAIMLLLTGQSPTLTRIYIITLHYVTVG